MNQVLYIDNHYDYINYQIVASTNLFSFSVKEEDLVC